ncbi:peptidoglycan editing factor PgeF [Allonocardiopsis opalescens]|uniref:Purine nucleoside phosphorylase n=1 Tax=Allonocardiopsis opalescens TaxID=1144618 RepID=A0A2T0Q3W8_9ACTN|nr:peptidoglycan editing factor PgeF [Allonocardiopsis opalescens]PRX98492.1 hypothetical protein CLV72_10469 [Allonocardiopsis opalescens]
MTRIFELGGGVRAAFPGRFDGGVSAAPYDRLNLGELVGDDPAAVTANRREAARALGLDPGRVVWMRQVHGAEVADAAAALPIDEHASGLDAGQADAVVGAGPGLALAVKVADCVPVLLAHPAAGVIGAVHSGRKGTESDVVGAAVARMAALGADPAGCAALIGPAVCGKCYEVPAELREQVGAAVPAAPCTTRQGTPGLDLRAGVRAQLHRAGVGTITEDDRCTVESPELFSHRRDGRTGRFAGFVWRPAGNGR